MSESTSENRAGGLLGGELCDSSPDAPARKAGSLPEILVEQLDERGLQEWDNFVSASSSPHLAALSSWKRFLEASFPHIRGHFLVVRNARSREITGGLPVYCVRSSLLGNRMVSVPFGTLFEPVVSSPEGMRILLENAIRLGVERAARRLEIRSCEPGSVLAQLSELGVSRLYKHHFIRLDMPLEAILKRFGRTSIRQMISKAEKNGLRVDETTVIDGLNEFYSLYARTRRSLSLPPIPYKFFRNLAVCLGPEKLSLLTARQGKRAVGTVLSFRWKKVFAMEYSGDDAAFRSKGLVQLLYWTAIKTAHQEGYSMFSFGRTSVNNRGLLAFKSHWGTEVRDLATYYFPPSAMEGDEKKENLWQYRLLRGVVRYLPLPLCRLVGNLCYRHLG